MKPSVTFTALKSSQMRWAWIGRMPYLKAEALQKDYEQARLVGEIPDTLLLLEHPPVYTLGRSASTADILEEVDIDVIRTDRGGQVTYHGPGQLVGYMIMSLRERSLKVPAFIWTVEEVLKGWFETAGIEVERRPSLPGLWYEGRKLASIGFHISRGITRHGFSINLQPDLGYFDRIIPCGQRLPVTSLERELKRQFNLADVASQIASAFDYMFSGSSGLKLNSSRELSSISDVRSSVSSS